LEKKLVQQRETEMIIMRKNERLLKKLSIAEVSHFAFTGHPLELQTFLIPRVSKLVFIGHPFTYAKEKRSYAKIYEESILVKQLDSPSFNMNEFLTYLKDFFFTFYFIFKSKKRYDVFIGADPLNAFAGIILKKLELVNFVVFYVIDYVPVRFKNPVLNSVYRSIDTLCVYNADSTWNLTSAMANARECNGIRKNRTKQIAVPTGIHFDKNACLPIEQIKKTDLAFLSHLRGGQGIELILEALPAIVKVIPSARLVVIGTGPLEEYFRDEVKKRNLTNNVMFLGFIENHDEIEKIISKCGVGLAPYVPDPNSFTWYADPGKPKVYLGCGIPVVITRVPEVALEIEKEGAGIAIKYDKDELVDAVVKLLTNDDFYRQCRLKALEFASKYSWDDVFYEAFNKALLS
jgi:glycosyltransferase involved in cell wall biosynthesis